MEFEKHNHKHYAKATTSHFCIDGCSECGVHSKLHHAQTRSNMVSFGVMCAVRTRL